MAIDTARRIQVYMERGWCPVPWGHHPGMIKSELRRIGLRPQMKQCFANCQRFIAQTALGDVEYHEGWVLSTIPVMHGWLVYAGDVVDLTLVPEREREYLSSIAYSKADVQRAVRLTHSWGVIDEGALLRVSPFRAQLEAFTNQLAGGAP